MSTSYKTYLRQIEDTLAEYLVKKAPALPSNVKEAIVKFAPWVTVIMLILTLPLLLAVFGIGAMFAPFSFMGGVSAGTSYLLTLVFTVVQIILEVMAVPGLFKNERRSWDLLFYAALVGVVQNVITFNVGGLLIGSLLYLYLLFQVREYYK